MDKRIARFGTVDNVDIAKDFVNNRIKSTLFGFFEDIVKSSISSFDVPYALRARAAAC